MAGARTAVVAETVAKPRVASPARIGLPVCRGSSKDARTRVRVSRIFKAVIAGLAGAPGGAGRGARCGVRCEIGPRHRAGRSKDASTTTQARSDQVSTWLASKRGAGSSPDCHRVRASPIVPRRASTRPAGLSAHRIAKQ